MLVFVEVIVVLGNEDDFGEIFGIVGEIEIGVRLCGDIEQVGDWDWFVVELDVGISYWFNLCGELFDGGMLLDGFFKLCEVDGIEFVLNNNSGIGIDVWVGFIVIESGMYYLEVVGSGGVVGMYLFEISIWFVVLLFFLFGEDDYGNDGCMVMLFGVGECIIGMVEQVGDYDWFVIDLEEGVDYCFLLCGVLFDCGMLVDFFFQFCDI